MLERLALFLDSDVRSAAENMAVDELLLRTARLPLLRFYGWERPAISIGYFFPWRTVSSLAAQKALVRRWTGGGLVFHSKDLTYSLIIPASDPSCRRSAAELYREVHMAIIHQLAGENICARLAPAAPASQKGGACFDHPVENDVIGLSGNKIAGAAQRRSRLGLLQQGSILHPVSAGFPRCLASAIGQKTEEILPAMDTAELSELTFKYGSPAWLERF